MEQILTKAERLEGCILGGAIGDAWGSGYELAQKDDSDTLYLSQPIKKIPPWRITDDTQSASSS